MKSRWIVRLFAVAAVLLALCLCLASCGKNATANDTYSEQGAVEKAPGNGLLSSDTSNSGVPAQTDRKIIKTFSINAETTEFDKALESLNALITEHGAYAESVSVNDNSLKNQNRSARTATYVVRVPAERAEDFVGSLGGYFNVTAKNASVDDISETYYSIEDTLEELQIERDSLLDMLEAPETKKDYDLWLKVTQRLSEVKQQIAVYQGRLERFDSQVAYSTVHLSIREVINYTVQSEGNSFGARLATAFREGWSNFAVAIQELVIWLAGAVPALLLLAVIATVVIVIVCIVRRRSARRAAKASTKSGLFRK